MHYDDINNEIDYLDLLRMERETIPDIELGEVVMEIARDELSEAQKVDYFFKTVIATM